MYWSRSLTNNKNSYIYGENEWPLTMKILIFFGENWPKVRQLAVNHVHDDISM